MSNHALQLPPGFRFHPTDEELIVHYLRNRLPATPPNPVSIIADVDIYKFDPWDLPEKALFGDREWYFFSPRDRKHPSGIRPNRTAPSGYWKVTGTDKPISSGGHNVGVKKALVFYKGRPPKGIKSNWIMHEYRLAELQNNNYRPKRLGDHSMRLDDWVLCRIYSRHLPRLMMKNEEHEGCSCKDYTCFPAQQSRAQFNLPKASSISEILEEYSPLSDLFDCRQEPSRFDYNPVINGRPNSIMQYRMGQSSECNGNGYLLPHISQVESSVSVGVKQQSPDERNKNESAGVSLYTSKEENDSIMTSQRLPSQFDTSQSSPFCNEFMAYFTFG